MLAGAAVRIVLTEVHVREKASQAPQRSRKGWWTTAKSAKQAGVAYAAGKAG
jgi:hypothetical protein